MGPFVPTFISEELNLVVAFFIGIAFGFVLEQAGFSNARRLTGLFYGRDFTVLRVFFSAALTAAFGVVIMGTMGMLDVKAIFVNPFFIGPAIVGGVIMGIGFILGGYCPGTSITGVAIGKIDAMFFVGGGLIGVLLYGEIYPAIASFVSSGAMGEALVYEGLGMSKMGFLAFLALAAIGAFVGAGYVERKLNPGDAPSKAHFTKWHFVAGGATAILAIALIGLPTREELLSRRVSTPSYIARHPVETMAVDELALHLVRNDPKVVVYDLRKPEPFAQQSIPKSVNIDWDDLFRSTYASDFAHVHVKKVLVADSQVQAEQAARILTAAGYLNFVVLNGGFGEFQKALLPQNPASIAAVDDPVLRDFRTRAHTTLVGQNAEIKAKGGAKKKAPMKVKGGC